MLIIIHTYAQSHHTNKHNSIDDTLTNKTITFLPVKCKMQLNIDVFIPLQCYFHYS